MNETQWKHRLQYARDHYPPGTRVRLLAMPDDPQPIPPGTTGTVMGVDDAGQTYEVGQRPVTEPSARNGFL